MIVIRSLVPGGIAEKDGRLLPGDRLMFVNDVNLENSSLEEAVGALKGAPSGIVRIGVAKPLPVRTGILLISCLFVREMPRETLYYHLGENNNYLESKSF